MLPLAWLTRANSRREMPIISHIQLFITDESIAVTHRQQCRKCGPSITICVASKGKRTSYLLQRCWPWKCRLIGMCSWLRSISPAINPGAAAAAGESRDTHSHSQTDSRHWSKSEEIFEVVSINSKQCTALHCSQEPECSQKSLFLI